MTRRSPRSRTAVCRRLVLVACTAALLAPAPVAPEERAAEPRPRPSGEPRDPAAATAQAPDDRSEGSAEAVVPGFDPALHAELQRVISKVESLRGHELARPPVAVRVPLPMHEVASEIRAHSVLPLERLEARGRAWEDLGLGDPQAPRRLLRRVASDLEGLALDPAGHRVLVGPNVLTDRDFRGAPGGEGPSAVLQATGMRPDEPVLAHALIHGLQLERRGSELLEPFTDRLLATAAWAEGEANLLAMQYVFGSLQAADAVFDFQLDPGSVLDGALYPPLLGDLRGIEGALARFIWVEGYFRTVEVFRADGWEGVERAAAGRRVTRDVLHGGAGEAPEASWSTPDPPSPGLVLADEDSLGEQAIIALVSHGTGKDNLGLIAGDGWAGDRVWRWEPAFAGAAPEGDDRPAATARTVWDTRWRDDQAAADFVYAARRILEARYGDEAVTASEDGTLLATGGRRRHEVRRQGRAVVWAVGAAADWPGDVDDEVAGPSG